MERVIRLSSLFLSLSSNAIYVDNIIDFISSSTILHSPDSISEQNNKYIRYVHNSNAECLVLLPYDLYSSSVFHSDLILAGLYSMFWSVFLSSKAKPFLRIYSGFKINRRRIFKHAHRSRMFCSGSCYFVWFCYTLLRQNRFHCEFVIHLCCVISFYWISGINLWITTVRSCLEIEAVRDNVNSVGSFY